MMLKQDKVRRVLTRDPKARNVDVARKVGCCAQLVIYVRRAMIKEARAERRQAAKRRAA